MFYPNTVIQEKQEITELDRQGMYDFIASWNFNYIVNLQKG